MSFLNLALLGGLGAIAIPIIIHLLNRRTAKVLDWGAMRFLLESVESRKKRIQLEEALLLAARCLVVGLIAAFGLSRIVEASLYQVSATDPLAVLRSVLILVAGSVLACLVPAVRATRVDPLVAIRGGG